MKLMKVSGKNKNMMIQEFQHFAELQLFQDSNLKMLPIQFVSMMMVIRMKLMKVICNDKNMMIQEFQLNRESKLI
jgi:hypothetical protein